MSYTMTMDLPPNTSEYIEQRGPRYRENLNAIFLAIVTADMRRDRDEKKRDHNPSLVDIFRSCPKDVDLDELIPPRSRCSGRAHPVDFAAFLQEDA